MSLMLPVSDGAARVQWQAPGPVSEQFVNAAVRCAGIVGPVGAGKTTTALVRILKVAMAQRRSPIDGVRRCKALVIRDVFTRLERTVLQTWHAWFPKSVGEWIGGPPARHILKLTHPFDGGPIHLHVDFMGLGDDSIESSLRSYEMTCFYINEADLLGWDELSFLLSRLGRYPSALHGGPTFSGGWLDFNMPEDDHWLLKLFIDGVMPGTENQVAKGFELFRQPGGLDEGAENLMNLGGGNIASGRQYYIDLRSTMSDWMARRMIDVTPTYARDGKPVYPEFNDQLHVPPAPIVPVKGIPIGIGFDAGGTPACALGQYLPGGRWNIIAEVVTGPGTGPSRFGQMILDCLAETFPGFTVNECYGWGDPSAAFGGDEEGGDPAWLTKVRAVTKIPLRTTASNNPHLRQEPMRAALKTLVDGKPAFQLSPACKVLRKAMNSQYRYRQLKGLGNTGRYDMKPEKNPYSHPAEGMEYLLQGGGHGALGMALADERRGSRQQTADSDYDMFGG